MTTHSHDVGGFSVNKQLFSCAGMRQGVTEQISNETAWWRWCWCSVDWCCGERMNKWHIFNEWMLLNERELELRMMRECWSTNRKRHRKKKTLNSSIINIADWLLFYLFSETMNTHTHTHKHQRYYHYAYRTIVYIFIVSLTSYICIYIIYRWVCVYIYIHAYILYLRYLLMIE